MTGIFVSLSKVLSKLQLDEWHQRMAGLSWGSDMSNEKFFSKKHKLKLNVML